MPEPGTPEKIGGLEKAAILLLSLGEQEAAQILKHLEPREVQIVGKTMASLSNIPRDRVTQVLTEFVDATDLLTPLGVESDAYIRKTLVNAIGKDNADSVADRILENKKTSGLESLKWMEAAAVAEMLHREHPQIIAIVLAYLEEAQCSEILGHLPEKLRLDVVMRIATLDGIPPTAFKELNEVMEKQFADKSHLKSNKIGGINKVAKILNLGDKKVIEQVINGIKDADQDLGAKIEEKMFIFEDLIKLSDRDMQNLLREISTDSLLLALKGASQAMKEKVMKNMSKRAAEMLQDDMDAKGPVRLSEVETAQKEILTAARKLADDGEISLGGAGGESFV